MSGTIAGRGDRVQSTPQPPLTSVLGLVGADAVDKSNQSPTKTEYGPAVAIVGSRTFSRIDLVTAFIDTLPFGTIVVSGGARGVDFEAARYAAFKRHPVKEFRLESFEWHLGKWMGPFRNELIVRYVKRLGGTVVVFVERAADGSITPGSASTIQHCHDLDCPLIVFDQNSEAAS